MSQQKMCASRSFRGSNTLCEYITRHIPGCVFNAQDTLYQWSSLGGRRGESVLSKTRREDVSYMFVRTPETVSGRRSHETKETKEGYSIIIALDNTTCQARGRLCQGDE